MIFFYFVPSHAFVSSFVALLNMFLLFIFIFYINKKIKNIYIEKSETYIFVYVYIGTYVPWMATETKFSKLCISCNLDEHFHAQLSK